VHDGAGTFISVMSRECASIPIGAGPGVCGIIPGSIAGFGFMIRATAQGLLPGPSRFAITRGLWGWRVTGQPGNKPLYCEPLNWNGFGATGFGTTGAVWAHIEVQPAAINTARLSIRVKFMGTSLSNSGFYRKIRSVNHA